jgi:hypothetical protein
MITGQSIVIRVKNALEKLFVIHFLSFRRLSSAIFVFPCTSVVE